MPNSPSPEQIDALLPQTQCGLCGFPGCMPYAKALAEKTADINLCPPGGVKGLRAIADLLERDATPYLAEMEQKTKPRLSAVIREAECIGCTKCIQACPVDAIMGASKLMHTVITDECTGCELCIAPCPVDCIDLIEIAASELNTNTANHFRQRYYAREQRLSLATRSQETIHAEQVNIGKKEFIQAALLRAKQKKQVSIS